MLKYDLREIRQRKNKYVLIAFLLVFSLTFSLVLFPQKVKAAFVIDDAAIILTVLGALGIAITDTAIIQNYQDWGSTSPQSLDDWDDNIADQWDYYVNDPDSPFYSYGDYNPLLPNDPDNKPPSWDQFKEFLKNNEGKIAIGSNLGIVLGAVGTKLINQFKASPSSDYDYLLNVGKLINPEVKYFVVRHDLNGKTTTIYFCSQDCAFYKYNSSQNNYRLRVKSGGSISSSSPLAIYNLDNNTIGSISNYSNFAVNFKPTEYSPVCEGSNIPRYNTQTLCDNYLNSLVDYSEPINTHINTDIDSDFEYGNITVPDAITVPEPSAMQALLDQLIDNIASASARQPVIKEIREVVTAPLPDPDPGTDPDPDPGTDPDPDPGTDPEISDSDINGLKLPSSIINKFPFCLPWDIVSCIKLFDSSRQAPQFTLPLKSSAYGIDENIEIDLSVFDSVAELLRILELIGSIVGLAFVTRQLIRG